MLKIIIIILILVIIGWIFKKFAFPLLRVIIKFLMGFITFAVVGILIVLIFFVRTAAFQGITQSPDEDGGPSIEERYPWVAKRNEKSTARIDSMEGKWLDRKIKKLQGIEE